MGRRIRVFQRGVGGASRCVSFVRSDRVRSPWRGTARCFVVLLSKFWWTGPERVAVASKGMARVLCIEGDPFRVQEEPSVEHPESTVGGRKADSSRRTGWRLVATDSVAPGGRSLEGVGLPSSVFEPHCRWRRRRGSGWLLGLVSLSLLEVGLGEEPCSRKGGEGLDSGARGRLELRGGCLAAWPSRTAVDLEPQR